MSQTEIHNRIKNDDVIDLYVRNKLSADERRAFQEHFFECDECFEQAQVAARFVAGVRDASRSGVLSPDLIPGVPAGSRPWPVANRGRWAAWLIPALAASLLLAVALAGLWALSLRRENQQLAALAVEQSRASDELRSLDTKIRELEAGDTALQEQTKSLREENSRLKEQLSSNGRPREDQPVQLGQLEINVPVRNIYPVGDAERSSSPGEANRIRVPHGTRTFVLILGGFKTGYPEYRLEIQDASGRVVARREGLKPDQSGELSVMFNRTQMNQSKYALKLYAQQKEIAEYVVQVE